VFSLGYPFVDEPKNSGARRQISEEKKWCFSPAELYEKTEPKAKTTF
jgi:hypothetical protein